MDLTEVEGIDVATATVILGETGGDVSRFPTAKHFASWLGLCPRQHQSNQDQPETRPSPRQEPGGPRPPPGGAVDRSDDHARWACFTGGSRAGPARPEPSLPPHTSWRDLIYTLLKHGTAYVHQSQTDEEARHRAHQERSLRRKARSLGFDLVAQASPEVT